MAVLRNGSKCSHTTCMLCFFTVARLALNSNLIFEIGSSEAKIPLLGGLGHPRLSLNLGKISLLIF